MIKILVTGTSGFVGGAIATQLVDREWNVVGLGRRLSTVKRMEQQVQIDIGDALSAERIFALVPACHAIVHAAASMDKDPYAPAISLTNCLGTQQMLRLAKMWEVKSFVYLSSIQVIGTPLLSPVIEEHPTNPLTAYHASKLYGEQLMRIAQREGLKTATLRLTSPIGPGMPENRIFSQFVIRALNNAPLQLAGRGTRQQNFVDVRDIAWAVERCLKQHVDGLFNIGGNCSISNLDLAQICMHTLGSSSQITFTGQADPEEGIIWNVSIAKAKNCFGYNPQYEIQDSIRAVSAGYAIGIDQ